MLAIAGLSVRAPVQQAAAEGLPVLALDVFGDVDTRAAASAWRAIGAADTLALDADLLCQALAEPWPGGGRVSGWLPASGLEADAGLLARAARVAPLLGTAPDDVARLRDPRTFFAALAALGLPHPPVRHDAPGAADGWLIKDGASCGGWGVRPAQAGAGPAAPAGSVYWQRRQAGVPMSATLLADGRHCVVLGHNLQQVRAQDGLPYTFAGLIGPVPVAEALAAQVADAARQLTAHFALRGLASLDFLCVDGGLSVLEVNPRWPASGQLYPGTAPPGLVAAHLRACREGRLPTRLAPVPSAEVRGLRIVHADRPLRIGAAASAWLAARPAVHDQPQPGTLLRPGDPLCSVSAAGRNAEAVDQALRQAEQQLLAHLVHLAGLAPQQPRSPQHPPEETRP